MIYNGKLYFCTNNQKPVFKQLGKNSHIEICACIGVDWLRISGKAVFDESMEAKKAVFEVDPGMSALYKQKMKFLRCSILRKAMQIFLRCLEEQ